MIKKGRKGRISNELVAASCAAILTVYAAGSWRTRDEARRFASEGQMRRPVRPESPAPMPVSTVSVSAKVAPQASASASSAPLAIHKPALAATKSLKVDPAPSPSPSPAALPQSPESAAPVTALVAVEQKSAPEAEPVVAVAAAEAVAPAPAHKRWLDGYYTGWGQSRHGDIQSFVTIEGGRIVNSGIATCETRYPCSVISHILLQPIDLQGPDVDAVSRATESADAYYTGLVKALENAETGTFRSARP